MGAQDKIKVYCVGKQKDRRGKNDSRGIEIILEYRRIIAKIHIQVKVAKKS